MLLTLGLSSPIFAWVVLPILIFLARVADVSIGTIRIIMLSRGKRILAPVLGFFELMIWLLAIGQIFQNLNQPLYYIAYAGGFAVGNYVGMWIEERLAMGVEVLRIITRTSATELVRTLRSHGYGLTVVRGEGATGPVRIIFTLLRRKDRPKVLSLLHEMNPKAFFSVEDVRMVAAGVFPTTAYRRAVFAWRGNRKTK